jgi:DNA-binding NtrC family response regulator
MKNILVVDDEMRIRDIYKKLLADEGFRVFDAPNASEANELIKKEDIDLALLDLRMAEVNGGTLYEVIQMFHKKLKVIVTSVYGLDKQKRIVPGAADYYDKSQELGILLSKIKHAIQA